MLEAVNGPIITPASLIEAEEGTRKVLIICGERAVQDRLIRFFGSRSYESEVYSSPERGLRRLGERCFHLLVLGSTELDRQTLIRIADIREHHPALPIILVFSPAERVRAKLSCTFDNLQIAGEQRLLGTGETMVTRRPSLTETKTAARTYRFDGIVGRSAKLLRVLEMVSRVADTRSTVLLRGENGTGKELIARAIHANSSRSEERFVAVNSAAVPAALLESILFGHVKGAFTSAMSDQKGLFEIANGGTLFLDEIADMSPEMQVKLLRVLQDRTFMPVGSSQEIRVDVRVIAASSVDIHDLVMAGSFRQDLYYRLNVIEIELPPLRERREDILELANFFLKRFAEESRRSIPTLTEEVRRRLLEYPWPGNIRELENVIERAVVLCSGSSIGSELIGDQLKSPLLHPGETLGDMVESWERGLILDMLRSCNGNCAEAARRFRVPLSTLHRKVRKLKIRLKRSRH